LFPVSASAGTPEDELAGLFVQACMVFVGHPTALRYWAAAMKLPPVPPDLATILLLGASGRVFDASNDAGKFILIARDDGMCATIADHAGDQAAAAALEAALRRAGATYRLVADQTDPKDPRIHHRVYLVARHGMSWRILMDTMRGEKPGHATLTVAPE
jgi:hypothetical protein